MRKVLFAFLIIGVLVGVAAAAGPMDVERITPEELKVRLERGERIILLDTRSRGAWNASDEKIKGAVRIPTDELAERVWELPFGAEIATYCT